MQWLGFVPWWIWVPYLVLWLYVMATLIMEDREPADTLAWAFALLLVPVFGMIFYFIAGRDWALITEKKGWMRDYCRRGFAPPSPRSSSATRAPTGASGSSSAAPTSSVFPTPCPARTASAS